MTDTDPAVRTARTSPARFADAADQARDDAAASKAPNTSCAYRCWADFTACGADHRLEPRPAQPATVALYVAQLGGHRRETVRAARGPVLQAGRP